MSSSSPAPPPAGPWWSRIALSPRAAVVLAGVVVVVALVVVLVGSLADRGGAGAGGLVVSGAPTAAEPSASPSAVGSATAGPASVGGTAATGAARVVVHVLGAVERDGVVRLPPSSRVTDAIEQAGGATADADLDRLNLARVVTDGERLYVPHVGEDEVPAALDPVDGGAAAAGGGGDGAAGPAGTSPDSVVDLNSADQAALETLPGIGPGLAGRILAWRDEHGRFAAVEDLLDVSGIGDVRFAELRDRVRV